MKYLGHVVSENGVQTDPDKINALASWPEPNNVNELLWPLSYRATVTKGKQQRSG